MTMAMATDTRLERADAGLIAAASRDCGIDRNHPDAIRTAWTVRRGSEFRLVVTGVYAGLGTCRGQRFVSVVVYPDYAQDDCSATDSPGLRERFGGPGLGGEAAEMAQAIADDLRVQIVAYKYNGMVAGHYLPRD
jgi:hypothetical protein